MKFTVTFKDPGGVHECVMEARESLLPLRREQMLDHVRQFVRYGGYITIEFDTEADTAIVKRVY